MAKETSKEIAAREGDGGAVAIPDDMLAEMEAASAAAKKEIDFQEDVRLPALQLIQATTAVDADVRPGDILDTLTGEAFKEVDVVPMTMFKSRVLFGAELGEPPACSSSNALDGYGDPGDQLEHRGPHGGGDCSRCPESNWRTGGRCKLRYNYLALVLGAPDGAPFDFLNDLPRGVTMQGTSAKVASRLNTLMVSGKYPWSSVIRLSSTQEKNDRGNYRVWGVSKARAAETAEMVAAFKLSKQVAASRSLSIEGDEMAAATASGAGADDVPF